MLESCPKALGVADDLARSLMPAALLWLPPSVPRFRTVNCCSAAATGTAGGTADGSLVRVASSQAARAAARQRPSMIRFMGHLLERWSSWSRAVTDPGHGRVY